MLGKLEWVKENNSIIVYISIPDIFTMQIAVAVYPIEESLEYTLGQIRKDMRGGIFNSTYPFHLLYSGGADCAICSKYRPVRGQRKDQRTNQLIIKIPH